MTVTLATLVALAVALVAASPAAIGVKVVSRTSNGTLANSDSSSEGTEQISGDGRGRGPAKAGATAIRRASQARTWSKSKIRISPRARRPS